MYQVPSQVGSRAKWSLAKPPGGLHGGGVCSHQGTDTTSRGEAGPNSASCWPQLALDTPLSTKGKPWHLGGSTGSWQRSLVASHLGEESWSWPGGWGGVAPSADTQTFRGADTQLAFLHGEAFPKQLPDPTAAGLDAPCGSEWGQWAVGHVQSHLQPPVLRELVHTQRYPGLWGPDVTSAGWEDITAPQNCMSGRANE